MTVNRFSDLEQCDLCVDGIYVGGRSGNAGDDPLPRLLAVSNQGGFRYRGSLGDLSMVVLTSSLSDPEWPDALDEESGTFTYYGDNKRPGRGLHETPRNGNELLRRVFELALTPETRANVPPIFVFARTGEWRDLRFLGLAVPGSRDVRPSEHLVAIWKTVNGHRFQNYRAQFTILDVPMVRRAWIADIQQGLIDTENAPPFWRDWSRGALPSPLAAPRALEHRTKAEQMPDNPEDQKVLATILAHFAQDPHSFERFAAMLTRLLLPDTVSLDLTRPSRDGGRDALGKLRVGHGSAPIVIDFALEAKCYAPTNSVGVRECSRLISRLRHRQFGILVTTSYVDAYAYREIKEDRHPIIVVSGRDIVELLRTHGYGTAASIKQLLNTQFRAGLEAE